TRREQLPPRRRHLCDARRIDGGSDLSDMDARSRAGKDGRDAGRARGALLARRGLRIRAHPPRTAPTGTTRGHRRAPRRNDGSDAMMLEKHAGRLLGIFLVVLVALNAWRLDQWGADSLR